MEEISELFILGDSLYSSGTHSFDLSSCDYGCDTRCSDCSDYCSCEDDDTCKNDPPCDYCGYKDDEPSDDCGSEEYS